MNSLSSHVLDTTLGVPAANMHLTLTSPDGETVDAITDNDGRCKDWRNMPITAGIYTLRFDTGSYLSHVHGKAFYPHVDIHFQVEENGGHYHIPLLISPFAFSSYRGS